MSKLSIDTNGNIHAERVYRYSGDSIYAELETEEEIQERTQLRAAFLQDKFGVPKELPRIEGQLWVPFEGGGFRLQLYNGDHWTWAVPVRDEAGELNLKAQITALEQLVQNHKAVLTEYQLWKRQSHDHNTPPQL